MNYTQNDYTPLTIQVIYYSLFQKKLFDDGSTIMKYFPEKVFGIFTSIRRHNELKKWPVDIHGCIGYWNNDFNDLTPDDLYNNLLRVSHDALWNDNRKKYFEPIENDPESSIELDFMLNPIYNINIKTGIITALKTPFSNKTYGIIIQTNNGLRRATYLPNVFPNISWNELIISIKNKAGITNDEFQLYAYKIQQIKAQFITLLTNRLFTDSCIYKFTRFLIDNMKKNLNFPFVYSTKDDFSKEESLKNNRLEWNSKDDVRNIATLSEVFRYIYYYKTISTPAEFKKIKEKIFKILNNFSKYSSQSLSFLGYIYSLPNIFKNNNIGNKINKNNSKNNFCKKLLKDLSTAEKDFARQEIIIGLNKAGCKIDQKDYPLSFDIKDTIFRMNWVIQAIISFNMIPSPELISILEKKIENEIFVSITNLETNYIAVAFEALCFVYNVYKSNGKLSILYKIFRLLYELEKRKNSFDIFYVFLNNSARVDITGHINNGLFQFHKI
jgi:AMMECR1 domain-containing protein